MITATIFLCWYIILSYSGRGEAQLQFRIAENHQKAIDQFNEFEYKGKKLCIKLSAENSTSTTNGAGKKYTKVEPLQPGKKEKAILQNDDATEIKTKKKKKSPKKRQIGEVDSEPIITSNAPPVEKKPKIEVDKKCSHQSQNGKINSIAPPIDKKPKTELDEKRYHKSQNGRIIVRNLNFKVR